jgi:hypothetical protein
MRKLCDQFLTASSSAPSFHPDIALDCLSPDVSPATKHGATTEDVRIAGAAKLAVFPRE